MTAQDPRTYLLPIRDALSNIANHTRDGRDAFFASTMIRDAVVRNLEIIGEAVKRLPSDATSRPSPGERSPGCAMCSSTTILGSTTTQCGLSWRSRLPNCVLRSSASLGLGSHETRRVNNMRQQPAAPEPPQRRRDRGATRPTRARFCRTTTGSRGSLRAAGACLYDTMPMRYAQSRACEARRAAPDRVGDRHPRACVRGRPSRTHGRGACHGDRPRR